MTETDARARRLAERIQVIVAETIERRIKDPRMGFVTITDVRVTGDLREATVFYTVLGDATEQADTAEALESAKGMLRTEVGRQTGIRHTPSLAFIADAIPETARHLDDLLLRRRRPTRRSTSRRRPRRMPVSQTRTATRQSSTGDQLDAELDEAGGASA